MSSPLDDLRPSTDDMVIWFLNTFRVLENSRQPQGTIPVSEILAYSDYFDLFCPLDYFVETIVEMDAKAIEHHIAQSNKKRVTFNG